MESARCSAGFLSLFVIPKTTSSIWWYYLKKRVNGITSFD